MIVRNGKVILDKTPTAEVVESGNVNPVSSNAVADFIKTYEVEVGTINVNITTETGFRTASIRIENIPYDDNYIYFCTSESIQDLRIINSVSNSQILGVLCLLFTTPKQITLYNQKIYIVAIRKH